MKKAEEVLKANIAVYNSEINDMSKFALSARELKMFTEMMDEYAKLKAIDFAKWHDKTDTLREKPTRWTELYDNYSNGHIF